MSIGLGYPDYQSYPQWRGPVFAQGLLSITSGDPYDLFEAVTNYASTYIFGQCDTGTGCTLVINFYTDSTKAVSVGQFIYVLAQGPFVSVIVPNIGNYLEIIVRTSQTGTQGFTLIVAPINVATAVPIYPTPNTGLVVQNQSIGSGSPYSSQLAQVRDGNGWLYFSTAGTYSNFSFAVFEQSEAGTNIGACLSGKGPSGPVGLNFVSGTNPLNISVTSSSATAATCDITARIVNV